MTTDSLGPTIWSAPLTRPNPTRPRTGGYHGRILRVDLSAGTAEVQTVREAVLRQVLGGVGLGTAILAACSRPGIDPFDPAAPVVFAFSPLVGGPFTTSAKFAVVAKSPLTTRLCDGLCSSAFALAGKRTGFDAFVIVGAAAEPAILVIEPDRVRLVEAARVWGMETSPAEEAIREAVSPACEVIVIGPAGENLVRYATLQHAGRHVGRGGLGAVLGAKRLKAIAVAGDVYCPVADPEQAGRLARELASRSLGPATEKYRLLGTIANVDLLNRIGALPSYGFGQSQVAEAEPLSATALRASGYAGRRSCAACTIGCEHRFRTAEGGSVRVEYEPLFALGAACGIWDQAAVRRAIARCDRLGLDAISAGVTLAFAMECNERGWLDGGFRFGAADHLEEWIEQIAYRRGVAGQLLADGVRRLARQLGPDAARRAPHVKGLELPGYDPRTLPLMAIGLAVSARGADHNRTSAYEADLTAAGDRLSPRREDVLRMIDVERRAALLDSLILCKFLRKAIEPFYAGCAEMLRVTTGWDVSAEELLETAERIIGLRRWYNQREGWQPEEDDLPQRFFEEALQTQTLGPVRLDRDQFLELRAAYYKAHGWTADGYVPSEWSERYGIVELLASLTQS